MRAARFVSTSPDPPTLTILFALQRAASLTQDIVLPSPSPRLDLRLGSGSATPAGVQLPTHKHRRPVLAHVLRPIREGHRHQGHEPLPSAGQPGVVRADDSEQPEQPTQRARPLRLPFLSRTSSH